MNTDVDLFVIGVGSGGVRAARMSAAYGARVATAEDRYMGGTCVNVGCVPKKLFYYASHFVEDFHDSEGYGWQPNSQAFEWQTLLDNKNAEIRRLNAIYKGMLDNAGVTHYDGRARIVDAHHVAVGAQVISTDKILIATGGWPVPLEIPGAEHAITSNEVFYLDDIPRRSLVIGGGYIGVEFAGIFQGLGAESHLSYRGPMFLRGFDDDVRSLVAEELRRKGVALYFNSVPESIDRQKDDSLLVRFADGSSLEVDLVLSAIGRNPAVSDIGLENVDVACRENGAIIVDEEFRTSEPSIYALGDVIDRVQLTPVAITEAMAFTRRQFLSQDTVMDYEGIPTAVFCQPNIGTVGLTETQALETGHSIDIYRSSFKALKHTLSGNEDRTMMKMVVDRDTDKVFGIHMVGADAGEIIQGMAVALKAGATKAVFDSTVGIHPTSAEEFVTMREPVTD